MRLARLEEWVLLLTQQHERLQSLEIQRSRTEMEKSIIADGEDGLS
jgi:hypothetical protein